MKMKTTRHWYFESPLTFSSSEGELKDNGDFEYPGTFGINTIFKGNHFATQEDAAMDLIKEIDSDIKAFESKKKSITREYLTKKENNNA